MTGTSVFVTGASGFVGRRLLPALVRGGRLVTALDRSGELGAAGATTGVTICQGDLLSPETYVDALRSCGVVVHLAAATGKASANEHHRVNALGTDALIDACRRAGVPRVLFVSSIAVSFGDQTGYHYAVAKASAEQTVRRSGLRVAIVRPTMVFGAGSPVETALSKLALLPLLVVPGTGRVRVQPVHVDDLVQCLIEVIARDLFDGGTFEVGGPDVLTVEALLQAIRLGRGGTPGRVLRLPLALLRVPALVAERAGLGAVFPVTAGQLASFCNDSTASSGPLTSAVPARMIPLSGMLEPAAVNATRSVETDRECRVFTRHLLGTDCDDVVLQAYRDAVERVPALRPTTAFDDVLLTSARRGLWWTRVADAYSSLLARDSTLRRRIVMLLAILECRAPFHQWIDGPVGGSSAMLWARVGFRVLLGILTAGVGVLIFVPTRLLMTAKGRER